MNGYSKTKSKAMSAPFAKSPLDYFPEQFVSSMKVLFDILDEDGTGFVLLADIQKEWHDDRVKGLPAGVLEALRKAAPSNGKLNFERFVGGLQMALLRNKNDPVSSSTNGKPNIAENMKDLVLTPNNSRSNAESISSKSRHFDVSVKAEVCQPTVNAKRDAGIHLRQRPQSVTSLAAVYKSKERGEGIAAECEITHRTCSMSRLADALTDCGAAPAGRGRGREDGRWVQAEGRRSGDGRPAASAMTGQHRGADVGVAREVVDVAREVVDEVPRRAVRRPVRRESRRHTVSSGVDFNIVKRMKQLEQERDVLLQGSDAVEGAYTWYQRQLQAVQRRQHDMRQAGTHQHDHNIEAHQERLNFETARIIEVNNQLRALVESSEKGFPLHMNLAVSTATRQGAMSAENFELNSENTMLIAQLRDHVTSLQQECEMKSERIMQLEKEKMQEHKQKCARINQLETEKSQVLRELFGALSKNRQTKSSYDDTTFI